MMTAEDIGVTVRRRIDEAFARCASREAGSITVERHHGIVVLKGTVHSLAARDLAEKAVWASPGVVAIDDQLDVAP